MCQPARRARARRQRHDLRDHTRLVSRSTPCEWSNVATKRKRKKPSADGILQAAERLFAEQGYGATSLRDLMTGAKVSTTAFYARFDSKEAVLDELMRGFVESLSVAVLEAAARARDVGEGLDAGAEVLVRSIVPHKNLVRLFFTEAPTSPKSKEVVRTLHLQLASLLIARLHKLREKGAVATPDATALGWALLGAMEMQLIRWSVLDDLTDKALGPALRASALAVLPGAISARP